MAAVELDPSRSECGEQYCTCRPAANATSGDDRAQWCEPQPVEVAIAGRRMVLPSHHERPPGRSIDTKPRQAAHLMENTMHRPRPLRPDRLRTIERPFGWIPFRILTSGLLIQLSLPARDLYFFLCLVADRYGISFYSDWRLALLLKQSEAQLAQTRQELVERDLLAYAGRVYQLLSLPPVPKQDATEAEQAGVILRRLGLGG
jgi:hypothetical protein